MGGRNRFAAAGSRELQEWGDAVGPGLEGGGVPTVRSKGDSSSGVPAAAYYIVLGRRVQVVQAH